MNNLKRTSYFWILTLEWKTYWDEPHLGWRQASVGGKGRHLQYCALFLYYNERLKRSPIFQCQNLLSLGFPTSSLLDLKITLPLYKRSHEYFPKFLNYLAIKKKNPELSQFCRTLKSVAPTQRKCTFKTSMSVGQAEKARPRSSALTGTIMKGRSSGQRTHTNDSVAALKLKHQGTSPACLPIILLITL